MSGSNVVPQGMWRTPRAKRVKLKGSEKIPSRRTRQVRLTVPDKKPRAQR